MTDPRSPSGHPHRQAIDLARFLAAFGIVVAHATVSPRDWVGHLALALFLILTAFLAVQSVARAGGRYGWLRRARRLFLPWVFWSVLYRLLDLAISDDPDRFIPLREPFSLLVGPAVHLWFLPFVILAMILVQPVALWVTDAQRLARALGLLLLGGVGLFWVHGAFILPEPFPQWAFALPLYAYGLLLAPAHRLGRVGWLLAGIAVLSGLMWWVDPQPWPLTALGAALLFELFWRLPLRHPILPWLGSVAFGIYLMHPFFMLFAYKAFGEDVGWLLKTAVAFGLSWAATLGIQRLPVLRTMV